VAIADARALVTLWEGLVGNGSVDEGRSEHGMRAGLAFVVSPATVPIWLGIRLAG